MPKILPTIKTKKIAVLGGEFVILTNEEAEEFAEFYPEKKSDLKFFDVVEIEGKEYLTSSNALLISLENMSYVDIRLLFEDELTFLEKKAKEKRVYHEKATGMHNGA